MSWNRIFKKRVKNESPIVPEETTVTTIQEENTSVKGESSTQAPYDYGLDGLGILLMSNDYGWKIHKENQKKVILTNPLDCKEKITLLGMISAWRGTGHTEWEAILGWYFIKTVVNAIEHNETEADITSLFNRDFLASNNRVFTQKQVYSHLIKFFDIVEETDEVLKLKVHI
ncbi:MAG: hypothetical protein IJ629_03190 [Clostridia bacterium]|nr:hypothetical protein [Clostridia bacterium]